MTERRRQLLRWVYFTYGILVIGATVFLLYGRPPITDKSITVAESVLLLPGIVLYVPSLLLSGGIHWSVLPLWTRMPLWGTLNVLGYLAIPVAIRAITTWWRERKTSGTQENIWRDLFRRPATMIVFGVGMLLLALNGVIQIHLGIAGPTDTANVVFGSLGVIGFWYLAYYQRRYGPVILATDQPPPAWTRWAVPLAAFTGAVMGGGLAYREAKILRWSAASAGLMAMTVTVASVVMALIVFRLVRKQRR